MLKNPKNKRFRDPIDRRCNLEMHSEMSKAQRSKKKKKERDKNRLKIAQSVQNLSDWDCFERSCKKIGGKNTCSNVDSALFLTLLYRDWQIGWTGDFNSSLDSNKNCLGNHNYKWDAALSWTDVWRFTKQEQIRYTWFIWSNHLMAVSGKFHTDC